MGLEDGLAAGGYDLSRSQAAARSSRACGPVAARAVARAWAVVDAIPSATTTSPQAVMTHHPARLACANDVPACPAATMAPMIATPSEIPTSRLVDAMAAATPACAAGMPDTAVLVIGGVTLPKPSPKIKIGRAS